MMMLNLRTIRGSPKFRAKRKKDQKSPSCSKLWVSLSDSAISVLPFSSIPTAIKSKTFKIEDSCWECSCQPTLVFQDLLSFLLSVELGLSCETCSFFTTISEGDSSTCMQGGCLLCLLMIGLATWLPWTLCLLWQLLWCALWVCSILAWNVVAARWRAKKSIS